MAIYQDQYTAMVIFAQSTTQFGVQNPNTINPNGLEPFNPPNPNTPNVEVKGNDANNLSGMAKKTTIGLAVYNSMKSVANYYKNNYGEIMQDSNVQVEINEAMNVLSMGATIGLSFATGGIVGGVASIIAVGTNVALQTKSFNRMMHRNQVQSEIMMARTQYATINGGR